MNEEKKTEWQSAVVANLTRDLLISMRPVTLEDGCLNVIKAATETITCINYPERPTWMAVVCALVATIKRAALTEEVNRFQWKLPELYARYLDDRTEAYLLENEDEDPIALKKHTDYMAYEVDNRNADVIWDAWVDHLNTADNPHLVPKINREVLAYFHFCALGAIYDLSHDI